MWKKAGLVAFFFFLVFGLDIRAQQENETDERPLINVKKGLSFSKDSLFQLNLRFRMQNRASAFSRAGNDLGVDRFDFRVRRLRLRFDGYLLNPKIAYYIQLSFSKNDLDLENGGLIPQPIRDAMVYYFFHDNFYLGFGQSKLPGNRQRVNSSGNMQLPDRSIANNRLTLDRDFGFFGYWKIPLGKPYLRLKGAVSTGDGRNASDIDEGLAYTLRAEYFPLGSFANNGAYSEGDLEFEPKPKLAVALGGHFNHRANRAGGTFGQELTHPNDVRALMADMSFKWQGWSLNAEYLYKHARVSGQPGVPPLIGQAWLFQAGRMLGKKSELVLRYAGWRPDAQVQWRYIAEDEYGLSYTYYINGHRIKCQGFLGYRSFDQRPALDAPRNFWQLTFQVEFGI